MKTIEELIEICRQRNEIDFLFNITKGVAESDGIGCGYSYVCNYTKEMFNDANKIKDKYYPEFNPSYCKYLEVGGIFIYYDYLKHIGALE